MSLPTWSHDRKCFYKYMTVKAVKAVLETNSLRWSSPKRFNDPFNLQFDPHMEYNQDRVVNRVLKRFLDVYNGQAQPVGGSTLDENAKLLRALMPTLTEAEIRSEHRPAVYETLNAIERGIPSLHDELRAVLARRKILCLSETSNNIVMWAHYTNNHTGAVIELSCIEKFDSAWGAAKPVRYMANMPLLADEEALVRSLMGRGSIASPDHFQNSVYVKAADWAHEKEWRILGGWENQEETEDVPFKPEELTAVYLGCRIGDADQDEIRRIAAKKYPHAAVHIVRKAARRFALEFAKVA
jgi:hypothetical protein